VNEVSVRDLDAVRRGGAPHVLLDVREADERAVAQVAGSAWIPMGQVPQRLAELPADQAIYVMCHHGGRSRRVTRFLNENGFPSATNVAGGIHAWACEIDPSVPTYE
jgi:rhodanese-related sulfurtransferase